MREQFYAIEFPRGTKEVVLSLEKVFVNGVFVDEDPEKKVHIQFFDSDLIKNRRGIIVTIQDVDGKIINRYEKYDKEGNDTDIMFSFGEDAYNIVVALTDEFYVVEIA